MNDIYSVKISFECTSLLFTITLQEVEESAGAPDRTHALYCAECDVQFRDDAALATHYGSSIKHADTNL